MRGGDQERDVAPSTLSALRVFSYHGTSVTAAERIMSSGFQPSTKEWDWLGDGAYFFQDAPMRAWVWAREQYPAEPAVLCAEIVLERCIDLLDIPWASVIRAAHERFRQEEMMLGHRPLRQDPLRGNRQLDRDVVNYAVGLLRLAGEEIGAVRATFQEGEPLYPFSALYERSHIQVAVRDMSLIKDVWRINEHGGRYL